jgi:hypothetical protein
MSFRGIPLLALVALSTACASTGATLNSGVGDAFLERPPYYAGRLRPDSAPGARTGIMPVAYQAGATQAAMFEPAAGAGSPVARLLAEMNAYLDSVQLADSSVPVRIVAAAGASADRVAPDVRFGCITEMDLPDSDCAVDDESALGRDNRVKLAVGRPSAAWTAWADTAMRAAGATRAIVLTLEVGQLMARQSGLRGNKSVELGSGHVVPVPWLTSLETPVQVVQLTGALMGPDGRAVRIGAEGIYAKRTRFALSALGAQELIRPEDVEAIRTQRRDDLPGKPLAWQEAMRQLVRRLTTN